VLITGFNSVTGNVIGGNVSTANVTKQLRKATNVVKKVGRSVKRVSR
jgi:hypothetical protein